MAVNSTAVWRVRVGGNSANGAGYDSGIAGAGTDYSQQDAAQLSLSDIACSATTTVTSATGGFTTAMIGNAIRITGGGATSGYYFITARTDTNTITVDRTPGTVAGGTGKVGGAADLPCRLTNSGPLVPGNDLYIRGSGTGNPSTVDYEETGLDHNGWPSGSASLPIRYIGENGRPFINGWGNWSWGAGGINHSVGLKIGAVSTYSALYLIYGSVAYDCIIDMKGSSGVGIALLTGACAINCYVYSSTSPHSSGTGISNNGGGYIYGNEVYNVGVGLNDSNGYGSGIIENNLVRGCLTYGIRVTHSGGAHCYVKNNTVIGGTGDGISVASQTLAIYSRIFGNVIVDHTTAGKCGIKVVGGTAANVTALSRYSWGYNNVYNNTTNYDGCEASATDLSVDPVFVDAGGGDYGVGEVMQQQNPLQFLISSAGIGYSDIGALQAALPAVAAPILIHKRRYVH